MKFFVTAAGDDDVGLPSRTSVVTIDDLPEDAMFWDEDTREEARMILNDAFSALLDAGCYVTFESDPPEPDEGDLLDFLEEERAMRERDDPDDDALIYDHEEGMETRG